jgi:hypothetical protein
MVVKPVSELASATEVDENSRFEGVDPISEPAGAAGVAGTSRVEEFEGAGRRLKLARV